MFRFLLLVKAMDRRSFHVQVDCNRLKKETDECPEPFLAGFVT